MQTGEIWLGYLGVERKIEGAVRKKGRKEKKKKEREERNGKKGEEEEEKREREEGIRDS